MKRAEKAVIENIMALSPYIYGLQESIEREQKRVINDMTSPAKKVVERLFELDNRRIDLCNIAVLNEFIKRGVTQPLDAEFGERAYREAKHAIELAGYTLDRAESEFAYLFKKLKTAKKKRDGAYGVPPAVGSCVSSAAD